MSDTYFALHGAILFSIDPEHLVSLEDGFVICRDGISLGAYETLPKEHEDVEVRDHWDKLILPGMSDLFSEAAAYHIRGMKMDQSLREYRKKVDRESRRLREGKYVNELAYDMYAEELYLGATTRCAVAGIGDEEEDRILMERIDASGIISCMGVVDEEHHFRGEYEWDIYSPRSNFNLQQEDQIRERGDFLVSCPHDQINFPLDHDIPDVAGWLSRGLNVGLGSGMGDDMSMLKVMKNAIRLSKLRAKTEGSSALSFEQAFYLATKGGGSYFGPCGSFEEGYQFDALILDDTSPMTVKEPSVRDRVERMVYLSAEQNICGKYVLGEKLY